MREANKVDRRSINPILSGWDINGRVKTTNNIRELIIMEVIKILGI